MEGLIMGEFAWIYWAILLAVAIIIILGIKREEILEFFSRIFAKKRRKSSYELFREYCRDSFEECAIHPVCNTLSSNPRLSAIIGNYRKIPDTVEADVREKYGDRVLDTVVRKNNDVAKAAFEYTDVVSAYPSSNGATDFKALVDELLEKM